MQDASHVSGGAEIECGGEGWGSEQAGREGTLQRKGMLKERQQAFLREPMMEHGEEMTAVGSERVMKRKKGMVTLKVRGV